MTPGFRPCGACAAYVDMERGCAHWDPTRRNEGRRRRADAQQRRYEATKLVKRMEREEVERFRAVMTGAAVRTWTWRPGHGQDKRTRAWVSRWRVREEFVAAFLARRDALR